MDIARCTLDGNEYSAVKFSKLSANERAHKRRHLVCVKCGTKALFVREAKSGQGPHFRARPHLNCDLAAPESERGEGGGDDKDMLRNPGDHIVLDLNFGSTQEVNGEPSGSTGAGSRGGRYVGGGAPRSAVSRRRLRPILKNLIYSDAFRVSEQTVEIPDIDVFQVKDLFVNFSEIKEEHLGKFRGFWGDIYGTKSGKNGALWINTGTKDDDTVSIPVAKELIDNFLMHHKVSIVELEGMHFLVFGYLDRSKANNKLWIKLQGIEFTALYGGA